MRAPPSDYTPERVESAQSGAMVTADDGERASRSRRPCGRSICS